MLRGFGSASVWRPGGNRDLWGMTQCPCVNRRSQALCADRPPPLTDLIKVSYSSPLSTPGVHIWSHPTPHWNSCALLANVSLSHLYTSCEALHSWSLNSDDTQQHHTAIEPARPPAWRRPAADRPPAGRSSSAEPCLRRPLVFLRRPVKGLQVPDWTRSWRAGNWQQRRTDALSWPETLELCCATAEGVRAAVRRNQKAATNWIPSQLRVYVVTMIFLNL